MVSGFEIEPVEAERPPLPDLPARASVEQGTLGVAVYDANCLFSKHIRHYLVGVAVYGLVRARWSKRLLEETAASLAARLHGDALEDLESGSRRRPTWFGRGRSRDMSPGCPSLTNFRIPTTVTLWLPRSSVGPPPS